MDIIDLLLALLQDMVLAAVPAVGLRWYLMFPFVRCATVRYWVPSVMVHAW